MSNASLSKTGILAVDTGSNIIFRLSREYDCTPAIFDDEILLRVAWEIPGNTTACKLQISDKDSMNLPLIYIVRQSPDVYENQTSAEGYINCTLIGKEWQVEGELNLTVYNSFTKSISNKKFNFKETFSEWKKKRGKNKFTFFRI